MSEFSPREVSFRVTGAQSVSRLCPLFQQLSVDGLVRFKEVSDDEIVQGKTLHFVWETFREISLKEFYSNALIINRLFNSQVIESKGSLAFLQEKMKLPSLKTFVLRNRSEIKRWVEENLYKEQTKENQENKPETTNWWVLKASNGNGGKDVWILTKETAESVLADLKHDEEYVIQKYIDSPILYNNKKFHFRCYASVHRDGFQGYIYPMCFILSAGEDYDPSSPDNTRHITNLSVNKHFEGHPGQVPCDLEKEYPEIYENFAAIWADIVEASSSFLEHQKHLMGFDFYGLDIISDTNGQSWLIEANRLPGLESSTQNKETEDKMYDDMMRSFLQIVLRPFFSPKFLSLDSLELQETLQNHPYHSLTNRWRLVTSQHTDNTKTTENTDKEICFHSPENDSHLNLFKWKIFTQRNKKNVMAYP